MRQPWAMGHCPFGAIGDGNYSIQMSKLQAGDEVTGQRP